MSARGFLAALLVVTLSSGLLLAGEAPPPKPEPKPPARTEPAEPKEAPEQKAARLEGFYAKAEGLYKDGKYLEAQRFYAQIALEDPGYGHVASRLRDIRGKLRDIEHRERLSQIESLLKQADEGFEAGQFDAAARACETVLAMDAGNVRAQRRLSDCAGELELQKRMFSIFENTEPTPDGRRVIAQAGTALTPGAAPTARPPAKGGAPIVRSPADVRAAPGAAPRGGGTGPTAERPPRRVDLTPTIPPDAEGAELLAKAWDLYQSAKIAQDPRPLLHEAMDTLAPITSISTHTKHTKATTAMLRKSIRRLLDQGGVALSSEEAKQARLYHCYLKAEDEYRKRHYDEVVRLTTAILDEDHGFTMARRLNQQARLRQQELVYDEMNLKHQLMIDRRLNEVEVEGVPPDELKPVARGPVSLEMPKVEVTSPELAEKLNQRVTANLIEADLDYFLDLLFRSTGVNIIYNPEVVAGLTITVHVSNYPLEQLLDYIARNHGLMFAKTRDGVLLTTPEEPRLETFVYPLRYGLVDPTIAPENAAVAQEGAAQPPVDPPATSAVESFLEQLPQLIEWPQGSFTYLDRKMNLLYVRTTTETYKKLLELLDPLDQIPLQVLIKALFVELDLEDFESIGVTSNIMCDHNSGESTGNLSFNFPSESVPGLTAPDSGGTFSVAGVMTDPQFDVTIDALQRTGNTRTLAAPSIICLNNCSARISVTKDLVYVEDYEVDRSDISGTSYGIPNNVIIDPNNPNFNPNNLNNLSSEPIIIPVFAEGEDTGFTLDVAPSIGKDTRYITLMLNPRIREEIPPRLTFELVFPVTRIQNVQDAADVEPQTATVERPIIGERSLTTKLTVADGAIVALGGLVQQKKIQIRSKIPILSDIPILGQFIGRNTFRDKKTILYLFVKAELITPTGARYADSGRIDETRAAEEAARAEAIGLEAPVVRPAP